MIVKTFFCITTKEYIIIELIFVSMQIFMLVGI